ncbi:reverse transcriptase family protein [uncultured Sneathiella sp.]|jgi:hypothetical protein|uniref:reverse transcriptase family protein n=1 Tax=uncultured Sneathiella sp. TaxID=879315 RepID=UPI0030D8112A|tara:strand:+ start:568 stop:2310 length:1743 start_codon:yes stop_codon:yes gene_type:complete
MTNFDYDLRLVKTRVQLLKYLSLNNHDLNRILQFDPLQYDERNDSGSPISALPPVFFRHEIPKRNKARGYRSVWEAHEYSDIYKAASRRLGIFLSEVKEGFPHPAAYGYVKGRNIRENASRHIGKRFLLKTDIENFFPSISIERVVNLFSDLDVSNDISKLLGNFLTIGDRLPLGLATSPLISNVVCFDLDADLTALANKMGAVYTRYADDITFSSDDALPETIQIANIIDRYCFKMVNEKTRHSKRGQSHYVTGLSISDPRAPHAPKRMKKSLRQELYFAEKFGLRDHLNNLGIDRISHQHFINRLDGLVKYVSHHEPKLAPKLYEVWAEILTESGCSPSFEPKNQNRTGFQMFFDETEFDWKNKKYLALGVSVSQHQEQINDETKRILNDWIADPLSDGDKSAIQKNGLHYADATEDLKKIYVECLQCLPFRGYVAFAKLDSDYSYQATYLKLLAAIIKRRLMAAESRFARLYFEKNNKVDESLIEDIVNKTYTALLLEKNRRPVACKSFFVSKKCYGVSVSDFLLGVLRKYLMSENSPTTKQIPREHVMYERLRDKYRLILDVDSGIEYSRRNPIKP